MGVQPRFGLWDRVKQLNIRGYIPCKVSEHVEGVLCSSRSRLLVVLLFTEIKCFFQQLSLRYNEPLFSHFTSRYVNSVFSLGHNRGDIRKFLPSP